MDSAFISTYVTQLLAQIADGIEANVLTPAVGMQAALVIATAAFAFALHRLILPPTKAFVEARSFTAAATRVLEAGIRLIGIVVFIAAISLVVAAIDLYFPDLGTKLLRTALSLAIAWTVIKLSASLIANRPLANVVAMLAWIAAGLEIVGLLRPLLASLDSVGLPLGAGRITLLSVINALVLVSLLLWASFFATALAAQRMQSSTVLSPRTQVLLVKVSRGVLITAAILITLSSVGVDLAALAVFAGALGVGLGIGLQHQVSNLLSGLFLLLDKSIKPGDVIETGTTYGWVKEMTARYVGVITRDNKEILIPNDMFVLDKVINWSHSDRHVRLEVTFGVSYNSDPHQIREIAVTAAQTVKRVAEKPAPVCHMVAFGDSSLDFVMRFWISDPEGGVTNVKGEVLLALWDTFKTHKIDIPFPHRHVIFANSPPSEPASGPSPQ